MGWAHMGWDAMGRHAVRHVHMGWACSHVSMHGMGMQQRDMQQVGNTAVGVTICFPMLSSHPIDRCMHHLTDPIEAPRIYVHPTHYVSTHPHLPNFGRPNHN